jgi:molecular chaperone DnaK (HSP70)
VRAREAPLSSSTQATIKIDSLFEGIGHSCSISRVRFEEPCMEEMNKFIVEVTMPGMEEMRSTP